MNKTREERRDDIFRKLAGMGDFEKMSFIGFFWDLMEEHITTLKLCRLEDHVSQRDLFQPELNQ